MNLIKKTISLLLLISYIQTTKGQSILDYTSVRSTSYSSLAYQVAKAVCPLTASEYYCMRITSFSSGEYGTRRAYFYFHFKGQTSLLASLTTFDLLLDVGLDDNNLLSNIYGGYEDQECKTALSVRKSIGDETYWGAIIYKLTFDTDYLTVRQKARYYYEY